MIQGCLTLLAIIIVGFVLLLIAVPALPKALGSSTLRVDDGIKRFAFIKKCHELITNQLKAPKTAEFRSDNDEFDHVFPLENGDLGLSTFVDSQNSFGALIRSDFVCSYSPTTNRVDVIPI